VVARAAGDDDDLLDAADVLVAHGELVEVQQAVLLQAAAEGLPDRRRLLLDLLEHEELVAALLGGVGVPVDVVALAVDDAPSEVGDRDAAATHLDDLVLLDRTRLAGVRDERGDVRSRRSSRRRRAR
jgi:hypothetical protein